jgi:hypothetical protein
MDIERYLSPIGEVKRSFASGCFGVTVSAKALDRTFLRTASVINSQPALELSVTPPLIF